MAIAACGHPCDVMVQSQRFAHSSTSALGPHDIRDICKYVLAGLSTRVPTDSVEQCRQKWLVATLHQSSNLHGWAVKGVAVQLGPQAVNHMEGSWSHKLFAYEILQNSHRLVKPCDNANQAWAICDHATIVGITGNLSILPSTTQHMKNNFHMHPLLVGSWTASQLCHPAGIKKNPGKEAVARSLCIPFGQDGDHRNLVDQILAI